MTTIVARARVHATASTLPVTKRMRACARPPRRAPRRGSPPSREWHLRGPTPPQRLDAVDVVGVLGVLAAPGQLQDGVQPGPDPAHLGRLVRSAAPACRPRLEGRRRGPCPAGRRPRPGRGSRPPPSAGSPFSSASSLRTASSCWRSRNSRAAACPCPPATSLRMVSVTSPSAKCSRRQPTSVLQPRGNLSAVSSST